MSGDPAASLGSLGRLDELPRVPLAIGPAPLVPARRVGREAGLGELWFKRDDLLGFGDGGNKIRGLEYFLADALAGRVDTLLTGAGAQSNHVRATAAAAAVAGLRMVAVYWGDRPEATEGNLLLSLRYGAEARFTGESDRSSVDRGIAAAVAELEAAGRRPYPIPRGGASALGVVGHVRAVRELRDDAERQGVEVGAVALAIGSGGTLAGWLLGTIALALPWRVVGWTVSRPAAEARVRVAELAAETASALGLSVTPEAVAARLEIRDGVIGEGYGIPTAAGDAAIERVARSEGILLDPTYTGKAFGGLLADPILPSRGATVFIHSGGEPANFVRRSAR